MVSVPISTKMNIFFGSFAIWPTFNPNFYTKLNRLLSLCKPIMHPKNFGKERKKLNKISIPPSWTRLDMKQFIEVEDQGQLMVDQNLKREKEVDKNLLDKKWI